MVGSPAELHAWPAEAAPVIDGRLDDPCSQQAAVTGGFQYASGGSPEDPAQPARTGEYEKLIEGRKVDARFGFAPSGKRMLLVDGRPQPLFWANLSGGGENYRRAGFNTVFAEFNYPGKTVPLDQAFAQWDKQLMAVKRQGLFCVIYIHNSIHSEAGKMPWLFDDAWRQYVQAIVKRYRPMTHLVGWTFSDEYGDQLSFPDDAFRDFLRRTYESIEALNTAWKTNYGSMEEIRLEYQHQGHGRPEPDMVQEIFPYGIGPKAFDSSRFKIERTAWANAQFEDAVREFDPDTPLWSGANNLGWPSTQIPPDWGAFFDFYPEYSGNDMLTHHVWAMDIGRGPNARPVMQMLLPEHAVHFNWHLDARVLRGWMVESAIHGAAGITFWPWSFLGIDNRPGDRSSNVERIDTVGTTIRQLQDSGIFEMMPTPTIAVLYQPYAEGWGNRSQVYGLLRYPTDEPIALFRELRFGTPCGQVEVLTSNTLGQARFEDYGVILAPFSCDLTEAHIGRLREFVNRGGVLVADVGFDCLRSGKTIESMSGEARELFGITSLSVSKSEPGPWVATGEFAALLGGLDPGRDRTDRLRRYTLDVTPSTAVAALQGPGRQGLYVNRVGKGYAIFSSALTWAETTVTDPLLRKLHLALFRRRATLHRAEADDWSAAVENPYYTQGYEIASFKSGCVLQNLTGDRQAMTLSMDNQDRRFDLPPRGVLLVRHGEQIPLGSGLWPVETGSVSNP